MILEGSLQAETNLFLGDLRKVLQMIFGQSSFAVLFMSIN